MFSQLSIFLKAQFANGRFIAPILSLALMTACTGDQSGSNQGSQQSVQQEVQTVTVYSSRAEYLIKPLFDRFTEQTGIKVRYTTDGEAALIARLQAEQERTPADVLLTVDAGNLWYASSQGLLQPIESELLSANVPSHLRASDNSWFGLSVRARTLVYSTERVAESELSSYESLADEQWYGRLCLRTSKKVYNQSLVASMISSLGEPQTEAVVQGWVNNLAIDPLSNDNLAMEAVIAGVCDVAVVNTYYFGRLMDEKPEAPLAIFWPNQNDRGVHVNISGIGMTRHAKQPQLAQTLIEWLTSDAAQKDFAGLNKEFPVNPAVSVVPQVAAWGEFKADAMDVELVGQLQTSAIKLMDRAGYR